MLPLLGAAALAGATALASAAGKEVGRGLGNQINNDANSLRNNISSRFTDNPQSRDEINEKQRQANANVISEIRNNEKRFDELRRNRGEESMYNSLENENPRGEFRGDDDFDNRYRYQNMDDGSMNRRRNRFDSVYDSRMNYGDSQSRFRDDSPIY